MCLDDVWDSSHEASFACIDTDTASRQLITTRIKGLLPGAAEVELELLGLQESVELLASVACLDDAEISPVCLEITHLSCTISVPESCPSCPSCRGGCPDGCPDVFDAN